MNSGKHQRQSEVRLDRSRGPSVSNWQKPTEKAREKMDRDAAIEMGWGRLIFGQTFQSSRDLADTLLAEQEGQRDLAMYLRDPHVVLSLAPDRLFLDPSHTYRLWSNRYRPGSRRASGFVIRRVETIADAEAANRIYAARGMVTADPDFMKQQSSARDRAYFIAVSERDAGVLGTITGVDHVEAFSDPENGASFWCLAVNPHCHIPGVGEALVRHVIEHHFGRGREYVDLSVMHDNAEAIRLYEKLGFKRIPAFCVKHRNPINEDYFVADQAGEGLNPYAQIIIDEAKRRGIVVEVLDKPAAYFTLTLGRRTVTCRESLTELTSAIAMSRCDDKRVTRRVFEKAGLSVPQQRVAGDEAENEAFLEKHGELVVKPARGEQGRGITVGVKDPALLKKAIVATREHCTTVVLERFVAGEDLRLIVIDYQVVAAAVRRPPEVVGAEGRTVRDLIERYSRRRQSATHGESAVPMDEQTERCVKDGGYAMDDVLPVGQRVRLRKTANLHTGGMIHDVTDKLHEELRRAAIAAARAVEIPVTGLDMIVPDVTEPDYVLIEANERPGLANHEPQPTAPRFIDFLFPQTVKR